MVRSLASRSIPDTVPPEGVFIVVIKHNDVAILTA